LRIRKDLIKTETKEVTSATPSPPAWLEEFKKLASYISLHAEGLRIHPQFNAIACPLDFKSIEKCIEERRCCDSISQINRECKNLFKATMKGIDLLDKKTQVCVKVILKQCV
jgi:hypothetical protein